MAGRLFSLPLGSRFLGLACAVSIALGACDELSTESNAAPANPTEQQPDPERVDAKLLAIPTVIDACKVRLVLSVRWRSSTKLEGTHADKSDAMKWIARGSAELQLKELRIKVSDEITVMFLDDYEDLVLHAIDVALYKRTKGKIVNREERVKAVTIANGQVSILSGEFAYLKWKVDAQVSIVSNRGRSPTERRDAMRALHSLMENPQFANDERYSKMIASAWRACVRTLSGNTPPELSIDMMKFFRRVLRDPKTIRIVVHFLYPQDIERNVTENVRIEATRTFAKLGEIAAIPTLIYTLKDDSRGVTRAIDVALCDLLDVRSKITTGAGPVTPKEQKFLREEWVRWARSPVGAAQLVKSIAALRVAVGGDEAFKRKQQRNPIADHLMQVVVMDDDMPFNAWKAGYEFTSAFLNRNFLPPELRKKPLTPELRAKAVEGVKKFLQGK